MPSVRSHFALAALASPLATGCFLSGDYTLGEQTVGVTSADSSEQSETPTSGDPTPPSPPPVTPPQVTPPSPPPPTPTLPSTSDASSSAEVETSSAVTTTSEPTLDVPTSEATPSSSAVATSEPTSSAQPTSSDAPSSDTSEPAAASSDTGNGWWNSSDNCRRGQQCVGNGTACANDEIQGPGGRCYWFGATTHNVTWSAAVTECAARGEDWTPITMHDDSEHGFLSSQLEGNSVKTWMGGQYTGGKWRWLDDDSVFWNGSDPGSAVVGVFNAWGGEEPSGSGNENCLRVQTYSGEFKWGDSECSALHLVACQGPLP